MSGNNHTPQSAGKIPDDTVQFLGCFKTHRKEASPVDVMSVQTQVASPAAKHGSLCRGKRLVCPAHGAIAELKKLPEHSVAASSTLHSNPGQDSLCRYLEAETIFKDANHLADICL